MPLMTSMIPPITVPTPSSIHVKVFNMVRSGKRAILIRKPTDSAKPFIRPDKNPIAPASATESPSALPNQ